MKTPLLHLILVMCISALVGYYIGVSKVTLEWKNYKPVLQAVSKEPPPSVQTVDFSLFWSVWEKLQNSYYDKKALDAQKLLNGAISGMVQSLGDPYTVFLPPTQNKDFKQGLAGRFEGIGAELGLKGKQIIVVAPLDGSPAQKAGVRAGDAILKVDNQSTVGWTLSQTVEKIRGPKGTSVVLNVAHKDENKAVDVRIVRDTITVKSVTTWVKRVKDIENIKDIKGFEDQEVAYIRLSQFGDNTNKEWLPIVNDLSLRIQEGSKVRGLILDLRNNPGGYLSDATHIASEFIDSGVVVMEERGTGEQNSFSVSRKGLFTKFPVVVLINKGSASASEIVAAALRERRRATLVGETSFGKGTIQTAEDLGNGAGIHITIAKWLTPNGTWIHGKGLTPDVNVAINPKDQSHDVQLEKAVEELVK